MFTFKRFEDEDYSFYEPMLDTCLAKLGSGEVDDLNTIFIAVIFNQGKGDNLSSVSIVTTQKAAEQHSVSIQNIKMLLTTQYKLTSVDYLYANPSDIKAILFIAKDKKTKTAANLNNKADSPALRELTNIVTQAVLESASDIHIYVYEDSAAAKFRVDGHFPTVLPLGKSAALSLIAAGLNSNSADYRSITDDEEMVDVSIYVDIEYQSAHNSKVLTKERINLRTSKSASLTGPHTVMRVIRTSQEAKKNINELGLDEDIADLLRESVEAPSGMILITGPTGSGKSTTLSAFLETIHSERKMILLEDPVEYVVKHPNCVQKPVYPQKKGLGFLEYLQNALRQDPDVIGISEMRNRAVAEIVIKSALTGHLMISTLHTTDSIGAISRLIDEGIKPGILAERGLLRSIVAQRLIPALCPHCRVKKDVPSFTNACITNESGCDKCNYTGSIGRVLIAEIIAFDDECRALIAQHNLIGLENHLIKQGWVSMTVRARRRVEQCVLDPYVAKRHVSNLFSNETNFKYTPPKFNNFNLTPIEEWAVESGIEIQNTGQL